MDTVDKGKAPREAGDVISADSVDVRDFVLVDSTNARDDADVTDVAKRATSHNSSGVAQSSTSTSTTTSTTFVDTTPVIVSRGTASEPATTSNSSMPQESKQYPQIVAWFIALGSSSLLLACWNYRPAVNALLIEMQQQLERLAQTLTYSYVADHLEDGVLFEYCEINMPQWCDNRYVESETSSYFYGSLFYWMLLPAVFVSVAYCAKRNLPTGEAGANGNQLGTFLITMIAAVVTVIVSAITSSIILSADANARICSGLPDMVNIDDATQFPNCAARNPGTYPVADANRLVSQFFKSEQQNIETAMSPTTVTLLDGFPNNVTLFMNLVLVLPTAAAAACCVLRSEPQAEQTSTRENTPLLASV